MYCDASVISDVILWRVKLVFAKYKFVSSYLCPQDQNHMFIRPHILCRTNSEELFKICWSLPLSLWHLLVKIPFKKYLTRWKGEGVFFGVWMAPKTTFEPRKKIIQISFQPRHSSVLTAIHLESPTGSNVAHRGLPKVHSAIVQWIVLTHPVQISCLVSFPLPWNTSKKPCFLPFTYTMW